MSTANPTPKEQMTMLQVPVDRGLHKKFKLKCMVLGTTMARITSAPDGGLSERQSEW
jgi:hypothetical protein